MARKIITATLHDMTPIPPGSIYRGDGMVEFACKTEPETIKEKLAEYDQEKQTYFKDKSISKLMLTADLVVSLDEKKSPIAKSDKLASVDIAVKK